MLHIPLSGIKKIEDSIRDNPRFISLSQGAMRIGSIPTQIKHHVQGILDTTKTDFYGYAGGLEALRDKICAVLNERYSTSLTPDMVIPTHGGVGALTLLYFTLLKPHDQVMIPEPSYPAYAHLAMSARCEIEWVSCLQQSSHKESGATARWIFDLDMIKQKTRPKTRMIVFSNPWNPMGIVVSGSMLRELAAWCEERGIYLVIDEAYRDYDFSGSLEPAIKLMSEYSCVMSVNSFSKNFAMSGWRIGYLVAPRKFIPSLISMQDTFLNCLNNISQYAALYALDHQELVHAFARAAQENRDYVHEQFTLLSQQTPLMWRKPEGGFFVFFNPHKEQTAEWCAQLLTKTGVSLVPGETFGPSGTDWVRLCFARDQDVLKEGVDRLANYLLQHEYHQE